MHGTMAAAAQCHEVLFAIGSHLAPVHEVMDLQLIPSAAVLAAPAIALQNFLGKLAVSIGIKPTPALLW